MMAQVSTLDTLSTPAHSPPASFATLPDELLDAIIDRLPSWYIIPALNRRLLPFNRARKLRILDLARSDYYRRNPYRLATEGLRSNPVLGHFVIRLHVELPLTGWQGKEDKKDKNRIGEASMSAEGLREGQNVEVAMNDGAVKQDQGRARMLEVEELDLLLSNLPNLRHLEIYGSHTFVDALLPGMDLLTSKPTLERLVLDSREYRSIAVDEYLYFEDGDDDDNRSIPFDPFDISSLRTIDGQYLNRYQHPDDSSDLLVDIQRTRSVTPPSTSNDSSYSLRLFARKLHNSFFFDLIRTLPLSTLHITDFSYDSDIFAYLEAVPDPTSLSSLSLFAFYNHQEFKDILTSFNNLSDLSLAGAAFVVSDETYEAIAELPLKGLHLGPGSWAEIEHVIKFVSSGSKRISSLQTLVLDNIDSQQAPLVNDYVDYEANDLYADRKVHRRLKDWVLPKWINFCTEEMVRRLKLAAEEVGVVTEGTTFFGLDIKEREEYREDSASAEELARVQADRRQKAWEKAEAKRAQDEYDQEMHDSVCSCHRQPYRCREYRGARGLKELEYDQDDHWKRRRY